MVEGLKFVDSRTLRKFPRDLNAIMCADLTADHEVPVTGPQVEPLADRIGHAVEQPGIYGVLRCAGA